MFEIIFDLKNFQFDWGKSFSLQQIDNIIDFILFIDKYYNENLMFNLLGEEYVDIRIGSTESDELYKNVLSLEIGDTNFAKIIINLSLNDDNSEKIIYMNKGVNEKFEFYKTEIKDIEVSFESFLSTYYLNIFRDNETIENIRIHTTELP